MVISIYDLAGRKVISGTTEDNKFDVSGLRTGAYIVSIVMNGQQTSGRLVISR